MLFTFFGDVKRIRNQLCKASVPAGSPSAKAAEGEKKAVFSLRETYDAIEHLRRMRNLRRVGVFSEDEYMKNAEKRLVLKEGYFLLSREDRLACLDDAVDQCEEIQELFFRGELSSRVRTKNRHAFEALKGLRSIAEPYFLRRNRPPGLTAAGNRAIIQNRQAKIPAAPNKMQRAIV